jgi:hypothetical protein
MNRPALSLPDRRASVLAFAVALGIATTALGSTAQAATVRPATPTCTLTSDNPFSYSGEPYGEGVEGLAQVHCTGTVYKLQIEAEIYNDSTGAYALSGWNTVYGNLQAGENAEEPLSAAYWQTCGGAYVWWTSTSDTYYTNCSPETYIS